VINLQHAAPNGQSIAPIASRPDVDKWVKTPLNLLFKRPDLTNTEVNCIQALMSFDWFGVGCHPCNETLMEACRLKDKGSMTRLLAGLQLKGYIRIVLVDQTPTNRSGRIIYLTIPPPVATADAPRLRGDSTPLFGAGGRYCSGTQGRAAPAQGAGTVQAHRDAPRRGGGTRRAEEGGRAAPARSEVDSSEVDEEKKTTTPLRGREEDSDIEQLLSSSWRVYQEDGRKVRKPSRPQVDGSAACLGRAVEPPAAVPLKPVVEAPGEPLASPPAVKPVPDLAPGFEPPDGSLASTLDRVMERAKVEPTADVAVEAPGNDDPGEPPAERAAKPPESDHRRRLHEWIKGLNLDAVAIAELVLLIREMVSILAGCRPAEGTTFDPYEQVRLALQGALEVEATGELSSSPGIYARGTIRKRISRDIFTPLVDPSIKAKAKAGPDLAELARLAAEQKQAEAEEAAKKAAETAELQARWNSLPDSQREMIKARVRAANPAIPPRWENVLMPLYLAAMADPPAVVEPPASEIIPPIEPAAIPGPPVVAAPICHRRSPASDETSPAFEDDAAKFKARDANQARQLAEYEAYRAARIPAARVEPLPPPVEGIVQEPDRRGGDAVQETGVGDVPIEAKPKPSVFRRLLVGTLALMAGVVS
jgi:hypothetical protein